MQLVKSVGLVVSHAHLRDSDPKQVKALFGFNTSTLGHRGASHEPSHDFREAESRLWCASSITIAQTLQLLLLTHLVFFKIIWVCSGNV